MLKAQCLAVFSFLAGYYRVIDTQPSRQLRSATLGLSPKNLLFQHYLLVSFGGASAGDLPRRTEPP